jgi:hypothetical protein
MYLGCKMLLKNLALIIVLGFSGITSAFAGVEDWTGVFTVQDPTGGLQNVNHTPNRVRFMFFSAGTCIKLAKGSRVNGIEFKEDISLCSGSDIQTFTNEVQKIGVILNKEVTVGPTYPS